MSIVENVVFLVKGRSDQRREWDILWRLDRAEALEIARRCQVQALDETIPMGSDRLVDPMMRRLQPRSRSRTRYLVVALGEGGTREVVWEEMQVLYPQPPSDAPGVILKVVCEPGCLAGDVVHLNLRGSVRISQGGYSPGMELAVGVVVDVGDDGYATVRVG